MRNYWIIWTYIANYSEAPIKVQAESKEDAAQKMRKYFSEDFARKATIYVMDVEPYTDTRKDGK